MACPIQSALEISIMNEMEIPAFLTRVDSVEHTSYYCEENIYRLVRDRLPAAQVDSSIVVFISGRSSDYVPLFCQRAAANRNSAVHWDYHVILVSRLPKGTWPSSIVFDLDTALRKDRGVSIPFHTYAAMTLYNAWSSHSATHELNSYIIPKAPRSFRLIPARDYLTYFASDRSHMIVKSGDGLDVWCSPPPPYDAIVNKYGGADTLSIYRDFKSEDYPKDSRFGRIVDEPGFLKEFGSPELEETLLALSAKSIHYHYLKEFLPLKLSSDEDQPSEGQTNGCSQRDPPTSKSRQDIEAEEAETLQASQSFHTGRVLPPLDRLAIELAGKPGLCMSVALDFALDKGPPVRTAILKHGRSQGSSGSSDMPPGKMSKLTIPSPKSLDDSLEPSPGRGAQLNDLAIAIHDDVPMSDSADRIVKDETGQSPDSGRGTDPTPIPHIQRERTDSQPVELDAPLREAPSASTVTHQNSAPPPPRTVMSLDYILDQPLPTRSYHFKFRRVDFEGACVRESPLL